LSIKNIISRIVHDINLDPALFRIVFRRQGDEYWDVPFNYIEIRGSFFSLPYSDTLYPLHRIVAIYDASGKYLLKRHYHAASVVMIPQGIQIYPGVKVCSCMPPFQLARFAWIILRHLEGMGEPSDYMEILGDYVEYNEFRIIISGYFKGTVIYGGHIYRGCPQIDYAKISDDLTHQRIYVYRRERRPHRIIHIIRKKPYIVLDDRLAPFPKSKYARLEKYSILEIENSPYCLIDQDTKQMLHPSNTIKICERSGVNCMRPTHILKRDWFWLEKATALITDYDCIPILK